MEKQSPNTPLVSIRCITYNHEAYIRDALEGFVMQQTTFPFEAIVHDDASTDGTADIIRKYAEKYPNIIKPIFETENQYSKHDGSLTRIMNAACTGKYVAMCEGDDYWIDPLKLQKQVDFLESHPDYTMCWSNAFWLNCRTGKKTPFDRYPISTQSPIEDVITKGGGFIPTCSIMVRKEVMDNMPAGAKGYYCGDYPLQVWSTYVGKSYYFADKTCTYRFMSQNSWTRRAEEEHGKDKRLKQFYEEKRMLEGLNEVTDYKHNVAFEQWMAHILFHFAMETGEMKLARPYLALRDKYGMFTDRAIRYKINNHPVLLYMLSVCRKIKYAIFK